ncbi:MAG: mercuric reductase [Thermoanaerobaculia bacterium]|nr:mercuric reductase [Thermoanaerobaculia bacterium]
MRADQVTGLIPDDGDDRRLLEHVRPSDWRNPTPSERYHLVVVGAGTGGLVSAAIASSLGARVALVERHLMGGDCLNFGCVPSKGVLRAARAWHEARRAAPEFGGPAVAPGPGDFARAMARMRQLRSEIAPVDGAARFRDMGVDVFLGEGRFVASDELAVGNARLRFRKAIVATGGRASAPSLEGLGDVPYLTNETVFSLTELPQRLGVLGGGPIGCELAQAFTRFGAEVHLFQRGHRLLPKDDAEAGAIVARALQREGVRVELEAEVRSVAAADDGIQVSFETAGAVQAQGVDQLLIAAGRRPNVEGLGLEAAGVEYSPRGIEVDSRLRTTNKNIFAIGDVASKLQFTHLADFQARLAVRNALFFGRGKAGDLVVPWCTYTSPEVAHVGHSPASAAEEGHEVETLTIPLEDVDRARLDGSSEGFLRVHLKKGSDRILGGTLVAEHAGDMIGHLSFAITHRLGLSKFSETMFPYPTQAEIFRKAGDQFNRRKLTPAASRFFDLWFRWFR